MSRWLSRAAFLAWFVGATLAAGEADAMAPGSFPPSIYPPAVHSRGGALSACPNPAGLDSFTAAATGAAKQSASRFDRVSEAVDLEDSDRAAWPQIREMWSSGKPAKGMADQVVDGSESASRSGYAVIVRFSCGAALVTKSLLVTIGPRNQQCEACRSQLFFIDRRGHALMYFTY